MLDKATFRTVVDSAPLVAVDLLLVRDGREVLLGLRNNRPAQGSWFAPGGRIYKNETIAQALRRVAGNELGLGAAVDRGELQPQLIGVFEHFYDDSFFGAGEVSTHYVVLAHRIDVAPGFEIPAMDAQHAELRWWRIDEALGAAAVHRFTRNYFATTSEFRAEFPRP